MLTLTNMISSNYENKFPDCLFVKLHGEIVSVSENYSSLNNPNSITNQIQLKLTIRFGKQKLQIDDIDINFGLKSGKLNLKFSNSKILLETLGLTPKFKTVIEIERQPEESQANEKSLALTLTRGGFTTKGNQVTTEARKFKDEKYQVYTQGTEEEMKWVFQLEASPPTLQGILQAENLGTLEVNSKPCQIEATFEIYQEDMHITVDGTTPEKAALVEKKFYSRLIESKLIPYISRAGLLYE